MPIISARLLRQSLNKIESLSDINEIDKIPFRHRYDQDPIKNKDAKLFKKLSYNEVIKKELKVMDTTAVVLCKENNIPLRIFNMLEKNSLIKIIDGKNIGTVIR